MRVEVSEPQVVDTLGQEVGNAITASGHLACGTKVLIRVVQSGR